MKIAILISGRINNSEELYKNTLENIVQDNEVDFFVSHTKNPNTNVLNDFINLYKPKIILESDEVYPDVTKYKKRAETNPHNVMCMYLNRLSVFYKFKDYVISNNITYDLIISFRCDLWFEQKIDLGSIVNDTNNNCICIPSGCDYGGINDQCAFGNMKTMNIYMTFFNQIINFLNNGIILHPETLLKHWLDSNHNILQIKRPNIKYCIKRI